MERRGGDRRKGERKEEKGENGEGGNEGAAR